MLDDADGKTIHYRVWRGLNDVWQAVQVAWMQISAVHKLDNILYLQSISFDTL